MAIADVIEFLTKRRAKMSVIKGKFKWHGEPKPVLGSSARKVMKAFEDIADDMSTFAMWSSEFRETHVFFLRSLRAKKAANVPEDAAFRIAVALEYVDCYLAKEIESMQTLLEKNRETMKRFPFLSDQERRAMVGLIRKLRKDD